MENTEQDVIDWHKETFPKSTIVAIHDKLLEEILELQDSTDVRDIVDEIADVAIVSIVLLNRFNTSLSKQVRKKLEINKNRTWGTETTNGDRPRVK